VDETLKLPVEADTAAFVANLARAAEALEKLALANQQSANKTEKNDKALEGLGEKLDALKSRTKDGIEVISQWAERINAAIEKVAELSDEGDRLARTQENLGVSLEQAQSNAVGFADETEIATAALTLQERGIRVTQQELNALTRIASSIAVMRRQSSAVLRTALDAVTYTVTESTDISAAPQSETEYFSDTERGFFAR
jgi:chromosome segregation ATPase